MHLGLVGCCPRATNHEPLERSREAFLRVICTARIRVAQYTGALDNALADDRLLRRARARERGFLAYGLVYLVRRTQWLKSEHSVRAVALIEEVHVVVFNVVG